MKIFLMKSSLVTVILLVLITILGGYLVTDGFKKPVDISQQGIKDNATRGYLATKQLYLILTKQRCVKPIKYSIGNLDERFNVSHKELLETLQKAEKIWEEHYNRNFFEYDEEANFKINLVYDERQKINQDKKIFDDYAKVSEEENEKLKEEHKKLDDEHTKLVDYLFDASEKLSDDVYDYEMRVIDYNYSMMPEKKIKKKLDKEREALEARRIKLVQQENYVNSLADKMNKIAKRGTKIVEEYNAKVKEFKEKHDVDKGRQFEEGEYSYNLGLGKINIYSFWDKNELVMILAHEFGHALGINHVGNPKSLMYYLNEQQNKNNLKLSSEDANALQTVCDL